MLINMLYSIFGGKKTNYLNLEDVKITQLVAQQIVMSLDGADHMPDVDKTRLACVMVDDLLRDMGIEAPAFLIEIGIGAGLRVMQELPASKDYGWRTNVSSSGGTGNANFAV